MSSGRRRRELGREHWLKIAKAMYDRYSAPGTAVDTINSALRDALRDRGNASALLGVGLLISVYSASGAIGAAIRSLESINRVKAGRSFLPNLGVRPGLTLLLMVLVFIAFLAVVRSVRGLSRLHPVRRELRVL